MIHLSRKEDSSSLLPIGAQGQFFPGTAEAGTLEVEVGPWGNGFRPGRSKARLSSRSTSRDSKERSCAAAKGSGSGSPTSTSRRRSSSFPRRSHGLADEVIRFLQEREFRMAGVYNPASAPDGRALQGDFFYATVDSNAGIAYSAS